MQRGPRNAASGILIGLLNNGKTKGQSKKNPRLSEDFLKQKNLTNKLEKIYTG